MQSETEVVKQSVFKGELILKADGEIIHQKPLWCIISTDNNGRFELNNLQRDNPQLGMLMFALDADPQKVEGAIHIENVLTVGLDVPKHCHEARGGYLFAMATELPRDVSDKLAAELKLRGLGEISKGATWNDVEDYVDQYGAPV